MEKLVQSAPERKVANKRTGRARWMIVVWDDPEVRAAIEDSLTERRIPVGVRVRDLLRADAGLPPFPAPPEPDKP